MTEFMQWFKKQITVADIAIILFLIAGFYYTTNYKFEVFFEGDHIHIGIDLQTL